MRFEAKCACGAEVIMEDPSRTFIVLGGERDDKGRACLIEVRWDEWRKEHENHATMKLASVKSHERT